METMSILFAGVGGQGIVLASKIVAKTAFNAGLMVKESELHGMAQRGGSVISHVRFGSDVHSPLIPRGKADILVALEELEGLRSLPYVKKGGRVIINKKQVMPSSLDAGSPGYPEDVRERFEAMGIAVDSVNALEIAKGLGNLKVENIVIVGLLSRYLPLPLPAWEAAIRESVPPKTIDINMQGFQKGRELFAGQPA
ncbi:MAG TPA: indolepyruvate oxidoreductase subunit beta [Dissulfurispiraceae bacterium]|nr:indolepyruvate oxidoreductase subunit beta [Dissulfurispiraceae bacterium]